LVVERDEAIVVDMEAGVEHLGRGTAQHVDTMLIITDANMKSLEIARTIDRLAESAGIKQIALVGNRIQNETQEKVVEDFAEKTGLTTLALVPFDKKVAEAEMRGETPLKYGDLEFVRAVEELCNKLMTRMTK
jgi:CO dehydrogenase maturation factor